VKNIKSLRVFESSDEELSQEITDFLDSCTKGSWNYNARSKKVSVDGDFDCSYQDLENFKGLKFSDVSGDFDCSDNDLKSLDGCPETVGKSFICSDNLLSDLKGGPFEVGMNYECSNNKLKSLEGAPDRVFGKFDCSWNDLTSLKGCPRIIYKSLDCSHNKKLKSLDGCPDIVEKNLDCSFGSLDSFKSFPKFVKGKLIAKDNQLDSFYDYATETTKDLDVSNNKIKSFVGLVTPINGKFIFDGNEIKIKDKDAFKKIFGSGMIPGIKFEDAILLNGAITKSSSGTSLVAPKIDPKAYERMSDDAKIENIKTLMNIVGDAKEVYSLIQKNQEGPAITSIIKNKIPDLWDKMKDIGRAKLSADMGDLFF
jgi:hypothetical protein